VTLTGVEVSPDLRHATVFYSVLGAEEQHEQTRVALRHAGGHLRGVLGREVRLKYLPELTFREDPAIVQGQRVEEIIRTLHRPERPEGGEQQP
jgi:ribosome-binding factor A